MSKLKAKNSLEISEITEVSLVGKGWKPVQPGATIDFIKGEKEGGSKMTLAEQIKKALLDAFSSTPAPATQAEVPVEKGTETPTPVVAPLDAEAIAKAVQTSMEPVMKAIKDEAEAQLAVLKKAAEDQIAAVNASVVQANEAIKKALEEAGVELGRMEQTLQQAGNGTDNIEKGKSGMEMKDVKDMNMHDAITTLLKQ